MSETVTFNIKYAEDKVESVRLDQQSKDILSKDKIQKFEDLGTSLVNGVFSGVEEGSKRIFEYAEATKIVQNANAIKLGLITLGVDTAIYLADEREKHGDNGNRDHIVAWSQAIVGSVFSSIGAIGGGLAGTLVSPGPGTIAGGIGGAMSFSIAYDVKNIGEKPASTWVGDVARNMYKKFNAQSIGENKDFLSLSSKERNEFILNLLDSRIESDNFFGDENLCTSLTSTPTPSIDLLNYFNNDHATISTSNTLNSLQVGVLNKYLELVRGDEDSNTENLYKTIEFFELQDLDNKSLKILFESILVIFFENNKDNHRIKKYYTEGMSILGNLTKNFHIEVEKLNSNCEGEGLSSEIKVIKGGINDSFFLISLGEITSRKIACNFLKESDTCVEESKDFLYRTLLDREEKVINPIIAKFSTSCEKLKQVNHKMLCLEELEALILMETSNLGMELSCIKDFKGIATIEFLEHFEQYFYEECYDEKDQKIIDLEKTYNLELYLIGFSDHAKTISGIIDYLYNQYE